MKKFLAILVVAILATSFSFAQTGAAGTGTGTVIVNVVYQDIDVVLQTDPALLTYTMMPNEVVYDKNMFFLASGSPGIGCTHTAGTWTGNVLEGNPGISILQGARPTHWISADNAFNGSGLAGFVYEFDVKCNPGTTNAAPYSLGFSFTVSYN